MEQGVTAQPPSPSLQNSMENFPASNHPVSVSDLKEMLISLRDSIHLDMVNMVANMNASMNDLQQRVVHIEHKMEDVFSAITS